MLFATFFGEKLTPPSDKMMQAAFDSLFKMGSDGGWMVFVGS